MRRFYLLQRLDTKQYFGTYGGDDYWTDDVEEAYEFSQNQNFILDDYTQDFLKEANSLFQAIEVLKIEG